MKITVDTHTHTIASDHSYSTVTEMARVASEVGLEAIAITDHGIAMSDSPHEWYFGNLKNIPRDIFGVKILYGIEANILDEKGSLDPLSEEQFKKFDIVNASIHGPCYSFTGDDHTETYYNIVKNPFVDIIGHSGTDKYKYDYETIIKLARDENKLIEINNHSYYARRASMPNCKKIAELCKKYGTGIVVSSDAHICFDLGKYDKAFEMLGEVDFPEELIMNRDFETLSEFFKAKGKPFFRWNAGE